MDGTGIDWKTTFEQVFARTIKLAVKVSGMELAYVEVASDENTLDVGVRVTDPEMAARREKRLASKIARRLPDEVNHLDVNIVHVTD